MEEEDPKAKGKAPPAKAPAATSEEDEGNEIKISIDNANEDETRKIVGFKMTVIH